MRDQALANDMENRNDKTEGDGSSPVPCSAGSEFAEGHRIGYEAGLRAGSLPDGEVARVLLPLGVTALSKVVDGLEKHFGDDLRMMQRGEWLIFIKPNDERTHPYQRGRASITGLGVYSGEVIETELLVGVAVARLVSLWSISWAPGCRSARQP
jgi:hypothetical protein